MRVPRQQRSALQLAVEHLLGALLLTQGSECDSVVLLSFKPDLEFALNVEEGALRQRVLGHLASHRN